MEVYRFDECKMGLKIGGEVEKVDGKLLSYTDFVEKYLVKNQPVILTGLMDHWRACKDWVLDNGDPNFRFLSTYFGNSRVQVIIPYDIVLWGSVWKLFLSLFFLFFSGKI